MPVKFRLLDASGGFIPSATATLSLAKTSESIEGVEEIPLPVSAATDNNVSFRYDPEADQYVYNLSTDTMTPGVWRLTAELDDGRVYTVEVSVRQ